MPEQFANNPSSTLSAAISSTGVTTFTVTSATPFSTTGTFRVLIDSEFIEVTSVSGTTFTGIRGAEGSTAATHLNGATVTQILTAGSLVQLTADVAAYTGQQATVNFSSSSPSTVTVVDGTDNPTRFLNLTGTALYTEQIAKVTPTPTTGRVFRYQVALTVGSGGLSILNGVGGSSILSLTAPAGGTTTYAVEVLFNGTNWIISGVRIVDILALVKVQKFVAVAGLQSTAQTVATRIGATRCDPSKYPANAVATFSAMVDTTGPQLTIQLYNLTAAALVSGSALTSSSTTSTTVSTTVTLPGSQQDYEVQLFSASGGITSDHVDCTKAEITLSWG